MCWTLFLRLIPLAFLSLACRQQEIETPESISTKQTHNAELAQLYEQDQTQRKAANIDWNTLAKEDQKRRQRVEEMLNAKALSTSRDFFHAAMIFQHGTDSIAYKKAHELAQRAVELDSSNATARWLTAATLDRYLLSLGKAQHYGTQYLMLDGVTYLQHIDTTQVSDSERKRKGVPTLREIRARLSEQNGEDRGLLQVPDSLKFEVVG